ncbi:uncharacterized protein [Amphiura filiformis]|uniref:uncharacterized protein n=1 Tax=Amphiura filiformis TaxID=82378 RepID=UPI003B2108E7
MDTNIRKQLLVKYNAPAWMESLQNIPTHRIKAAIENTPIERWYLPGVPDGFEVYIKREDLTGNVLSGNKVRLFEFAFGEAIQHDCTSICSAGRTQSNEMRTMAIMASSLGMSAHIVVFDAEKENNEGNNLLLCMSGAHRYLMPNNVDKSDVDKDVWTRVKMLAEQIRKESGENVYIFKASTNPCIFGYLNVFDEMLRQDVESFSDIVVGCVAGKTSFGLGVGSHLNGCNIKIHSLVIGQSKAYAVTAMNKMLQYVGLQAPDGSGSAPEEFVHMTENLGAGYGISTQEEIEFVKQVAAQTGIFLGLTYSGKAAYHMVKQLNEQPEQFRGKKILFIHTGDVFGLFDGRMRNTYDNEKESVTML